MAFGLDPLGDAIFPPELGVVEEVVVIVGSMPTEGWGLDPLGDYLYPPEIGLWAIVQSSSSSSSSTGALPTPDPNPLPGPEPQPAPVPVPAGGVAIVIGGGGYGRDRPYLIPRLNPPVLPPSVLSLGTEFQPERFRSLIYTHVSSTRIRWFRAWQDPGYDQETAEYDKTRGSSVFREEVDYATQFRALINVVDRHVIRLLPVGTVRTGGLVVVTMADELPLGENDIIVPVGKSESANLPDSAWLTDKQTMVRGGTLEDGAGRISSRGTLITGEGTQFLSFFHAGSIIRTVDQYRVVSSVQDDTHMTLSAPFEHDLGGVRYQRAVDIFQNPPVFFIDGIRTSAGFVSPDTYALGAKGDRLEWLSADRAPAPGEKYSIIYRYFPRYIIRGTLGIENAPTVRGRMLTQAVYAERAGGPIAT